MKRIYIITVLLILSAAGLTAQHRGDNLSFQGLTFKNDFGVVPTAMGNAYTAASGSINSIFYNPAGLAGITKFQFSASANSYDKRWRENQNYRPNRLFVTLPFYLEGLYIPDPANNGRWDHEIAKDTTFLYTVQQPKLGLDPYSEEAADWQQKQTVFSLNNISAAVPFNIGNEKFAAAVSYYSQYDLLDFDRNDTYLSPHIGTLIYGPAPRVNGVDTLVMQWSKFLRERKGTISNITGALAYNFDENFNFGLSFNYAWGSSDDRLVLDRVGSFMLSRENRFYFNYEDAFYDEIKGTSDFSAVSIKLGALGKFEKVSVGINVTLPYTMERDWNYTKTSSDTAGTTTSNISGTDKFELPLVYSIGISFTPITNFTIAFDYENAAFSQVKYTPAFADTTFRKWVDRNSIKLGLSYTPFDMLTLMSGYKYIPEAFSPDGAAFNEKGPNGESFTFGLSINVVYGFIDIAYEIQKMRYYESYYSNTNYVTETYNNLLFGYRIEF